MDSTNFAANAAGRERPVVLQAKNLVKSYKIKKFGKRRVVDGVSFEVREGEIVGLLGANGAGKTTSFRMACGLIPADSGTVILNGLDVTSWPMYRRAREGRLGYLPQDRSAFGSLTTEENLYATMEFLNYSRAEMQIECEAAIEKFNLHRIRKTRVGMGGSGGVSGGERRRLEIARALLAKPRILLLDEPFANVDPITVEGIQKVVAQLASEGIAVLITDHQVQETLAITDRSYIVDRGKVICSGTPIEVLQNEAARQYYFGSKADSLIRDFLKAQENGTQQRSSSNEESEMKRLERTTNAPTFGTPRRDDGTNSRRTLSLNRRGESDAPTGRPSSAPTAEPNRYVEKIGRIFGEDRENGDEKR